jgi:putative hydrolase of HD superfamily
VFYRIKANREHYEQLTSWVLNELEPRIRPLGEEFWQRLVDYHLRPAEKTNTLSDRILNAAHLYASRWEFSLIEPLNFFDEEMKECEVEGTELLARAICHELDHLDGHIYVEKVEGELYDVNYDEDEE